MDVKHDFATRLDHLLTLEGYPDKQHGRITHLARDWGVTPKTASNWLLGEKLPQLERMLEMAVKYKCNADWLMTGRGPVRPDPCPLSLTEEERAHIKALRAMEPSNRERMFQVVSVFSPKPEDHAA